MHLSNNNNMIAVSLRANFSKTSKQHEKYANNEVHMTNGFSSIQQGRALNVHTMVGLYFDKLINYTDLSIDIIEFNIYHYLSETSEWEEL